MKAEAGSGGRVAVVMAGGRGQRFWPLSTDAKPKQFLDLERCGRTLLQATFDRILPLVGTPDRIIVATAARYEAMVCEQLPELPPGNVIIEPVGRDSAPAIALASLLVRSRFGDVTTAVFSSDHRVGDGAAFCTTLRTAFDIAESERGLVTVGITPTRAATGYGYIETGDPCGDGFRVRAFEEKPTQRRAESYLAGGRHLWNAGIFVWSVDVALAELDRHAPKLMRPLRSAFEAGRVAEEFGELPKISIDYALMERTDRAYVVPGSFDWDDVGDWVALERYLPDSNRDGTNTVIGRHVGLDATGNVLYTESDEDVIVTLGIENLIIVKRGNTLLLARKDRMQDIKTLLADERMADLLE